MTHIQIGIDCTNNEPVIIPDASRLQGTYVIGKNGTGKTTLFRQMIEQDIRNGHGVVLFDPHGQLVDEVLRSPVLRPRIDDVGLIDASDAEYPFALNLFTCRDHTNPAEVSLTADRVVQAFKKVWGVGSSASWGPRLEHLLNTIAYTFIVNPGTTMADIPGVLDDLSYRHQLMARVRNPHVLRAWQRYDKLTRREIEERIESTLNKVELFLFNELLANIVSQKETSIDFRWQMDNKKILLVKLPWGEIGEEATALLGSIMVGQVLSAAASRAGTNYLPNYHLYADEYQRFATVAFSQLIDEARKYGIATTIAHQRRDQLEEERNAPLGSANIIVLQVVPQDAQELAGAFTAKLAPREVVGQRQKHVITMNAVAELTSRLQENPRIRAFVDAYLRPWEQGASGRGFKKFRFPDIEIDGFRVAPYWTRSTNEGGLDVGLSRLNVYFARCMEGTLAPGSREEATLLAAALIPVREYFGFAGKRRYASSVDLLNIPEGMRPPDCLVPDVLAAMDVELPEVVCIWQRQPQLGEMGFRVMRRPVLQQEYDAVQYDSVIVIAQMELKRGLEWENEYHGAHCEFVVRTEVSQSRGWHSTVGYGSWKTNPDAPSWEEFQREKEQQIEDRKESLLSPRANVDGWIEAIIDVEWKRLEVVLRDFLAFGRLLRDHPIMVTSGEWEDQLGPEEPIANAQNRLTNELATLDPFIAKVRLRVSDTAFSEHSMRTVER